MFKPVEVSIVEQGERIATTQAQIEETAAMIAELQAQVAMWKEYRKTLKKRLNGQKQYLRRIKLVGRGSDDDLLIANAGAGIEDALKLA